MLRRALHDITGMRIHATDGDLGHVHDVYVDDGQWLVQWPFPSSHGVWAGAELAGDLHNLMIETRGREVTAPLPKQIRVALGRQTIGSLPGFTPSELRPRAIDRYIDYFGDVGRRR